MFTGKLVKLRAYKSEDIEKAQAYVNDPDFKRLVMPGVPYPLTLKDEETFIQKQSAFTDTYSFAIETLDGEYIGGCGTNKVDWKNSNCVIGIFIGHKDYWNKGYGSDALEILVNFIFKEMNLNRITLNVFGFNARAIRAYEKCGFVKEGVLRQAIFKDGSYHDDVVMGLLREDYFKKI